MWRSWLVTWTSNGMMVQAGGADAATTSGRSVDTTSDTGERDSRRVRWPMLASFAVISTLLVVGWLVIDKDMRGMPLLSDDSSDKTVPMSTADAADVCVEPPLLTVGRSGDERILVVAGSEGLTLSQAESALAELGYDVTFRPAPGAPSRSSPGDMVSLTRGGDTVALVVDGELVLVEPGDGSITAEVACRPR